MNNLGTAIWLEASYQGYLQAMHEHDVTDFADRKRWVAWLYPTWKGGAPSLFAQRHYGLRPIE
jgi:hypothetical protein